MKKHFCLDFCNSQILKNNIENKIEFSYEPRIGQSNYTNYNIELPIKNRSGNGSTVVTPPLVLSAICENQKNAHGVTLHQINRFNNLIDVTCLHFK